MSFYAYPPLEFRDFSVLENNQPQSVLLIKSENWYNSFCTEVLFLSIQVYTMHSYILQDKHYYQVTVSSIFALKLFQQIVDKIANQNDFFHFSDLSIVLQLYKANAKHCRSFYTITHFIFYIHPSF